MKKFLCLALVLIGCATHHKFSERKIAGQIQDLSGYAYDPKDTSCDGYPRLAVKTMPGTCLGLVLPKARAAGTLMLRRLVQIPGTKNFLVVDMGSWGAPTGGIYFMSRGASGYELKPLKKGLAQPHGFVLHTDGYFYIGEKTKISRFHFVNGAITDWQLVVGSLEKNVGYMHPLSQFTFDPTSGDLLINSGSPSDHCFLEGKGQYKSCPESAVLGRGTILRVPASKIVNPPANGNVPYVFAAQGLRNSMAMVVHPSGMLVQGENSRDFPEAEEPYEEINAIDLKGTSFHYGWPYCYDMNATSPEWAFPENKNLPIHKQFKKPVDCSLSAGVEPGDYQPPHALMPPHVAPLHMDYYQGSMFPELKGKLLVTWHGHTPMGQRLVAYPVDARGLPILTGDGGSYGFNQKEGCSVRRQFRPHAGMKNFAPYEEVISGWNAMKGLRPKGAPVSFTVADDGSIYIAEDRKNAVVVRLARSNVGYRGPCAESGPQPVLSADPRIEYLAWRNFVKGNPVVEREYLKVQAELIDKNCLGCHADLKSAEIDGGRFSRLDFLVEHEWIKGGARDESPLYGAITQSGGYPPMPPMDKKQFHGTPEGSKLEESVGAWIDSLTPEIEKTFTRITMGSARQIRVSPSAGANSCGQVLAGDVVYVDPRAEFRPKAEGWLWTKVYLVPGHSRLLPGKCVYPEDGVFWVALVKQ